MRALIVTTNGTEELMEGKELIYSLLFTHVMVVIIDYGNSSLVYPDAS